MDIANEDNSSDTDYIPDEDDADNSETDTPIKSKGSALSQNLNDDDEKQKDRNKDADSDDNAVSAGGTNRWIKHGKPFEEQIHRRRSKLWNKFSITNEIERLATCNICGQELCYASSSNLKKHLYRKHGDMEHIKDWKIGKCTNSVNRRHSKEPKRYSAVWNGFDVTNERTRTATCKVCKKQLSFLTTIGNLKKHLRRKHSWLSLDQPYVEDEDREAEIAEEQTSAVWAYFKCLSKNLKLASCLICKNRLDYNDEQDLSSHLGKKHPRALKELERDTKPKKLMITGDGDIYEIEDNVTKQEPVTHMEDQDTGSDGWPYNNDETDAVDNSEYLDETIFNESKPSPAKKIRFTPDRRTSRTQPVTATRTTQPVRKSIHIDNRKSTQESEDPIDLFGKYMISLLKELPRHKSDKLQMDFIRLIMEAKVNNCQNTSNVNNSYQNTRSSSSVINIRSPKSIDDAITSNSDVQRVITSNGEIRHLVVENEIIVSSGGNQ